MIDVDYFKKFNDVHGHQAGDEVLRGVAKVLTSTMREMDMVARFGGEEFSLVLPMTNLNEGVRAAERARVAIEKAKFAFEGTELQVTASIGVAEVLDVDNSGTLVKRADAALYAAKKAGRNRVWLQDGDDCRPAVAASPAPTVTEPAAATTSAAKSETPAAASTPPTVAAPTAPAPAPAATTAVSKPTAPQGTAGGPSNTLQETPAAVFATDLRRRLLECQQYSVPLALMFVEIDDFSQLVSESGAATGELLLKTFSDLVGRSLTEMDVVSRLGGRLAVMMPGTNLQNAVRAAERVRNAAANCRVKFRGAEIQCTASLGVTEALAGDNPTSLSQRADSALLASKAAGKNCTHAHDGAYCGLVRGAAAASAATPMVEPTPALST